MYEREFANENRSFIDAMFAADWHLADTYKPDVLEPVQGCFRCEATGYPYMRKVQWAHELVQWTGHRWITVMHQQPTNAPYFWHYLPKCVTEVQP